MFFAFCVVTLGLGYMTERAGSEARAHPSKAMVMTVSIAVLVLLSWSIADCLYVPLEAMLDGIVEMAMANSSGKQEAAKIVALMGNMTMTTLS